MGSRKGLGLKDSNRFGRSRSISYLVPVVIVVVLIIAFAAGYFAGVGKTTAVTQVQTTTYTTTKSASAAAPNPSCVTLKNCPTSFVYFTYGASQNRGLALNPGNITVIIGTNNTVVWENLDTVSHSIVGANNLFSSGELSPGQVWNYTFTTPGIYTYSSPSYPFVNGTVIVVRSTATTSAIGSNPNDNW